MFDDHVIQARQVATCKGIKHSSVVDQRLRLHPTGAIVVIEFDSV